MMTLWLQAAGPIVTHVQIDDEKDDAYNLNVLSEKIKHSCMLEESPTVVLDKVTNGMKLCHKTLEFDHYIRNLLRNSHIRKVLFENCSSHHNLMLNMINYGQVGAAFDWVSADVDKISTEGLENIQLKRLLSDYLFLKIATGVNDQPLTKKLQQLCEEAGESAIFEQYNQLLLDNTSNITFDEKMLNLLSMPEPSEMLKLIFDKGKVNLSNYIVVLVQNLHPEYRWLSYFDLFLNPNHNASANEVFKQLIQLLRQKEARNDDNLRVLFSLAALQVLIDNEKFVPEYVTNEKWFDANITKILKTDFTLPAIKKISTNQEQLEQYEQRLKALFLSQVFELMLK